MVSLVKTDIFNRALSLVGARTVAGTDEGTPEAVQCALHYDAARLAALRSFPHPFALCKRALALLAYDGRQYAYAMPEDCVKLRSVADGRGRSVPFEILGKTVFCGIARAYALYTKDEKDCSKWDALFADAVVLKLACAICPALGPSGKLQVLLQLSADAEKRCNMQSASEGKTAPREDPWIREMLR